MAANFTVSAAPHIRSRDTTAGIMWLVFLALVPSGIAGVVLFGVPALKIILIAVAAAVLTEALIQRCMKKKVSVGDGSAALTGLLLAFNLSAGVPWWVPLVGSVFAVAIAKHAFGGLGSNIFNPALAARAFLMASWPRHMTSFVKPFGGTDAVTAATPLQLLKEGGAADLVSAGYSYMDLLLGRRGGCIGEVCIAALLLGAVVLLWRKIIWWQAPISFVLTVGALSWAFGGKGWGGGDFLGSILSGGLVLGAFFMATDYVTTPVTRSGSFIFGVGCGLLTFVIRRFGGYPEGVSYAILMMNATVPLIDRFVQPRRYGRP